MRNRRQLRVWEGKPINEEPLDQGAGIAKQPLRQQENPYGNDDMSVCWSKCPRPQWLIVKREREEEQRTGKEREVESEQKKEERRGDKREG